MKKHLIRSTHQQVAESLEDIGIDKPYINIHKEDLQESNSNDPLYKGKTKIKIGRRVRQGDTLSPKLFTAVLENIFKKLDWENKGIRINGEYLSHLRFADILIFSNNPEELENMLKDLAEASTNVGLKINLEKTKVMFNSFA